MKQQEARIGKVKFIKGPRREKKSCLYCDRALSKSNKSGLCNYHFTEDRMNKRRKDEDLK